MLDGSRIVVVVPARDEEERIGSVVETLPAIVDVVVVVDDGSIDATAERALERGGARTSVLRHERSRGVGAAIATGYRHALALAGTPRDVFVVMAGDAQMDPRDLEALVRPVVDGDADYAKGNRFAWPGARSMIPRGRWLGGHVFSALTRAALAISIDDSQCGYTAIARDACARLDLGDLYPRYGYPNDLLGQLVARGLRVRDVVVRPVYAGEKSGIGLRHVPHIGLLVVRAWLRRRRAGR